jgi:hypothetical protein
VRERKIEQVEGELVELQRVAQARKETRQARDLDSVARLAVERGYAAGWIAKRLSVIGARRVSFSEIAAAIQRAKKETA